MEINFKYDQINKKKKANLNNRIIFYKSNFYIIFI